MTTRAPGLGALTVLLGFACSPDGPPRSAPPTDDGVFGGCSGADVYIADGPVPGLPEPEAVDAPGDPSWRPPYEVTGIRHERLAGCERIVIELAARDRDAGGADSQAEGASPGGRSGPAAGMRATVLRGLGLVRVSLPRVGTVDPSATDLDPDGPLAGPTYAIWSAEGPWVEVDVHLAAEAVVFVRVLDGPLRVIVELRPGGGGLPEPAAIGPRVVVLEPRSGSASYPLRVSGYSRTFEANVVARIESGGGATPDTFTTATAWVDAWGRYSLLFETGPAGPVRLHVGEYSARDGSWEGVEVPLEMGR